MQDLDHQQYFGLLRTLARAVGIRVLSPGVVLALLKLLN